MSEVTFPGHGEPAETCGIIIEMGCWDCQGYFTVRSKCMKKSCPDCYPDWAYRQGFHAAERMTEFLNSPDYMKVLEDAERERWEGAQTDPDATVEERRLYRIQTYHIAISFVGVDLSDGSDIAKLRRDARDIGRRHGLLGECTIPHQRDREDEGAHFHFLGLAGYITPGRGDGSDYIFKVIKSKKHGHPRSFLGRLNVVKYACTHAAITDDTHCVTWSGCVANNKFPGVAEVDLILEASPTCPLCGGDHTFQVNPPLHGHRAGGPPTWVSPDRPPPSEPQRRVAEYS